MSKSEKVKQLVREIETLADGGFFVVWDATMREVVAAFERRGMSRQQAVKSLVDFALERHESFCYDDDEWKSLRH